jgi:DNA-directed RNA polymerase specialized sigma24 family protein
LLGSFRPESDFYPWFSRIVIHEALKQCKRRSRFRLLTLDSPPGEWPEFLTAPPDDTPELALAIREERKRLWRMMADAYPDYENYQRRTDRQIPVVVLEPVA